MPLLPADRPLAQRTPAPGAGPPEKTPWVAAQRRGSRAAKTLPRPHVTSARALLYHPHVPLLVTAGGLSADGSQWIKPKHPNFLAPEAALAILFRAKRCAALQKAGWLQQVSPQVWKKKWVVPCKAAGAGRKGLQYLARYVFRIAIPNRRLEQIDNQPVTFRYRDNHTQRLRRATPPAREFIRRFLQHVLPPGCTKGRYYGLWSNSCRRPLEQARALLDAPPRAASASLAWPAEPAVSFPPPTRCPHCRLGQLIVIQVLLPERKLPP